MNPLSVPQSSLEKMILTQINLQEEINIQIHAAWRTQHNPWFRAIWTECAEMLDHVGWKWWKKKTPQPDQVKLEIVDIWHFGLSALLQNEQDHFKLTKDIVAAFLDRPSAPNQDIVSIIELLAAHALTEKMFCLATFNQLLIASDFSHDELFRHYVGKNILNGFRQKKGYKDGTYRKTWHGREDNEHLAELVNEIDINDAAFTEKLEAALEARYL